jgi:sugar phosphate isomerase/epimerase
MSFTQGRRVAFGFSLYGMKTLAPTEALGACAEIGYDAVELALMPGWPTEPGRVGAAGRGELRKRMEGLGLELAGLMENVHAVCDDAAHRANLERLKAAAEFGHAVMPSPLNKGEPGSVAMAGDVILETVLGGRPAQWEDVKEEMAKRLEDWARVAEAAEMTIAIKAHVSGALHTPEGAQWLRRRVGSPRIKLAYDYSHFALRGFPMERTIATMIPDTVFIHVKDSAGDAENVRFLLPGEGDIDYARYLKLLRAAEYRGPVVVEVSGQVQNRPGYDAIAAARRSYANLAPAFAAAGLRRSEPRP